MKISRKELSRKFYPVKSLWQFTPSVFLFKRGNSIVAFFLKQTYKSTEIPYKITHIWFVKSFSTSLILLFKQTDKFTNNDTYSIYILWIKLVATRMFAINTKRNMCNNYISRNPTEQLIEIEINKWKKNRFLLHTDGTICAAIVPFGKKHRHFNVIIVKRIANRTTESASVERRLTLSVWPPTPAAGQRSRGGGPLFVQVLIENEPRDLLARGRQFRGPRTGGGGRGAQVPGALRGPTPGAKVAIGIDLHACKCLCVGGRGHPPPVRGRHPAMMMDAGGGGGGHVLRVFATFAYNVAVLRGPLQWMVFRRG